MHKSSLVRQVGRHFRRHPEREKVQRALGYISAIQYDRRYGNSRNIDTDLLVLKKILT